ncbi:unnamed protein product [Xylocopa violacea]|uniref:PiggyBac transposable element-derived protein domain-containing protein n=1 Tax=Xylocopa violacea TaxID=135666 RepID=A0ABP1P309_XYLVO
MVSRENKEIYADDLSDVDCDERELDIDNNDSDIDDNDSDSSIRPMRRTRVFPLSLSDDESENDYEEEIIHQWTEVDIPPTIEPFLDRTGLNILPQNGVEGSLDVFLDDNFYEMMIKETNRYHHQNVEKYVKKKKTIKWTDLTIGEFKKFLGLLILMGQIPKSTIDEYWTTDPLLETPIFPKTMIRDRFKKIWRWWHFVNNDEMDESSDRLFKIRPVYDSLVKKFNTVYTSRKEISLDESNGI